MWVRAVRGDDGVTLVEMAGLGRSESAKVPEELGDLAGILYEQAPGASDPDDDPADSEASPDPRVVPAEGAEK